MSSGQEIIAVLLWEYFMIILFPKLTSREVTYTIFYKIKIPNLPITTLRRSATIYSDHFLATFSHCPTESAQPSHCCHKQTIIVCLHKTEVQLYLGNGVDFGYYVFKTTL